MSDEEITKLYEQYIQVFFSGPGLQRIMSVMFESCSPEIHDAATSTLHMFLTKRVCITLTDVGIVPFEGTPSALFPYSKMQLSQLQLLAQCIEHTGEQLVVSTRMGGGRMASVRGLPLRRLQHSDVLDAFCTLCLQGSGSEAVRYAACSLTLQNISVRVRIDKKTMITIYESLRRNQSRIEPAHSPHTPTTP